MADRYSVFYLGNVDSIDPTEGNSVTENAALLQSQSFGSSGDPLYDNVQTLSPGSTGYGNSSADAYNSNNSANGGPDTFRINDGADQTFDAIATYNATITYANGMPPQTVVAIVFQDTNGNLYLVPASSSNPSTSYQAALEAGPIQSITFGAPVSTNSNMSGSRVAAEYVQPDGWFDGSAGADALNSGDFDSEADQIDASANAIDGGAGNDTINAGGGADTVFGGAGDDVLNGGAGADLLRGDSAIGAETSFSWASQGIGDGSSVTGGLTGTTASGDIRVAMTVAQEANFQSATMETTDQLYDYNGLNDRSSISVFGGAPGADPNTATISINFTALNANVSNEVSKVTFGIFDIDQANGFNDEIFVRAYDANNNRVAVNLTAGNSTTLSVDDATGRAYSTGAGVGNTDSMTGFVKVEIAGPVARIEIDYNNPNPGDTTHAMRIGDLALSPITTTGAGNDTISGGAGNDTIFGEAGNDSLSGGADNDSISGGAGNDTIVGGTGNDTMSGGDGADLFVAQDGFGTDIITGGEGGTDNDTLDFSPLTGAVSVNYTGAEAGTVTSGANSVSFSQVENLFLSNFNDIVDATRYAVSLDTRGGADTISVGSGTYDINAGDGDDRIIRTEVTNSTEAASVIDGGAGTDTYVAGGALGINTINLAANQLEFQGASRGSLLNFENVELDNIDATVVGNDGANVITATGDFANLLSGGGGDDLISAGGGDDTVDGGTGNDTLDGGLGNDRLTGGAGDDVFIYSGGNDVITDFNAGNTGTLDDGDATNNDFIDLSDYYGNIFDLKADLSDNGILDQSNFATVDFTGKTLFSGGSLEFLGAGPSSFTAENTGVVCFGKGTAIRTPNGDVLVEDLRVGDLVTTLDNGPQRIRWINSRSYEASQMAAATHIHPVLIKRGLFGAGRDLWVSQQHGILLGRAGDQFARAKHLAESTEGVRIARGKKSVTYIHLMFDAHQVIFAENVPSESFYPGPMALNSMTAQDRFNFSYVMPALGLGAVEPGTVVKAYGTTARPFITRKNLLKIAGPNADARAKLDWSKMKTPSPATLLESAKLAQTQAGQKTTCRRRFGQPAIAC